MQIFFTFPQLPGRMAPAPRILLTGFEPFGNVEVNPTEEIVNEISKRIPSHAKEHLTTMVLPVTSEASSLVDSRLKEDFDYVVHLGLHLKIEDIALERIGINIDDYRIPDNTGVRLRDRPIDPKGENAYFVSLPVRDIEKALLDRDIPCHISYSAGTYLCNHLLYTTLNFIAQNKLGTRAGFIHVPPIGKMNLELMIKATLMTLEVLGLLFSSSI